jgi:hypothetical protein
MMEIDMEKAGYIIYQNRVIWAWGRTISEAREEAKRNIDTNTFDPLHGMMRGGLGEPEEKIRFYYAPATSDLCGDIEVDCKSRGWRFVNGIACTRRDEMKLLKASA